MDADRCANFKMTRRRALNAGIAALAAACPAWPSPQRPTGAVSGDTTATDDPPFKTPTEPPNTPLGVGKGVRPGRVVWAHEPKVASWDGKTGNWWDDANTDPRIVDAMVSGNLRALTGALMRRFAVPTSKPAPTRTLSNSCATFSAAITAMRSAPITFPALRISFILESR